MPGANGQDESKEDCVKNLAEAVKLILEVNEEEAMQEDPRATKTTLAIV